MNTTSAPRERTLAVSPSISRGYFARSSFGPNCNGFTKMLTTTKSAAFRAVSISRRCPSCRAPIVGTNAMRLPRARAAATTFRTSGILVRTSTVPRSAPRAPARSEAVVVIREPARANIVAELAHCPAHLFRQVAIAPDELRREPVVEAEQVRQHQDLAIAIDPCPDADGGNGKRLGHPGRERRGYELEHDGEGAGVLKPLCLLDHPVSGFGLAALHAKAAEGMHRLRGEAEMAHDRDAKARHRAHRGFDLRAAPFELHGLGPGLLRNAAAIPHRLFGAHLIGEEGHVDD